ncbi:MAG: phenylacetate-CoA oxygenase subunit PaaJ [Saprospiraceae bacterium]|jgi:ring-1,2-phenylacetyl-CoA epoxidase subunit PaaD|nr:phenylacetate-CoA oxygenase subunit PaaJ [Saprospiraceae bacterium]
MVIDRNHILEILKEVSDPEIPVLTIEDLGILRNAIVDDNGNVTVHITPTYTGCPAMDMIRVNILAALQEHGISNVEVIQSLNPIWTTDWISEDGKRKLKEYGIAPPIEQTTDKSFIKGEKKIIPCPQCESINTEMVSLFGSTACKAFYKCLDCKEPFDYFKCH